MTKLQKEETVHRFVEVAPAREDGSLSLTAVCVKCDETIRNYPYMGHPAHRVFADRNGASFKAYYCEVCYNVTSSESESKKS